MTPNDDLRALAEAATPGPWTTKTWASHAVGTVPGARRAVHIASTHTTHDDALYIAAASPTVVLALLDENAKLRAALTNLAAAAEAARDPVLDYAIAIARAALGAAS